MGLQMLTNSNTLEKRLSQIGDQAVKGMSATLRRAAIRIRDLARAYAPVKTGLLELNINYSVIRDANRRNSYIVFIDLDAVRFNGKGDLGDYGLIMHRDLTPYGRKLNLGKRSLSKAARGNKVGGRFLTRAATEGLKDILGKAAADVRRATSSAQSGMGFQHQQDSRD